MIKLKKLLTEIDGTNVWKTPKDTPDQVITILHHIMAQIMKKGRNSAEYVALHSYKDKGGRYWKVVNRKDNKRGLIYKEDEQCWYSADPAMKAPLNPVILNALIKRWVVDVMGEARIPTYRWETPDNAPDNVVKIFHYLVATILKRHDLVS